MKRKIIVIAVLSISILLVGLIPIGPSNVIYRNVNYSESSIYRGYDSINITGSSDTPDHLVSDEKLYLRYQTSRSSLLLATYIDEYKWDIDRINKLKKNYPEYDKYWYKGGAFWIVE